MSKYTTARLARLRRLRSKKKLTVSKVKKIAQKVICLLYTSDAADE